MPVQPSYFEVSPSIGRILVVEDQERLLASLVRALGEEGYAADQASDGEEALHLARSYDYDAIILDVMLPKHDGWEVLATLRRAKTTPVLMLTARDAAEDRIRGLDTGADDYLVKPFDLGELLARLRALIRRSKRTARPDIAFGDHVLHPGTKTVTRAGEVIVLTGREYSILEYLVFNRGTVVSGTELHEHIFGEADDTLSNLIAVHVFSLRKKLGPEVIVTRRGLGYSIAP